jgi:hypothetical protein
LTSGYVDIFDSYLQNNIDVCHSDTPTQLQNNELDAKWSENS